MPIVVNGTFNIEIYTEPCMSCYKHIQYCKTETFDSRELTDRKAIICPNCGNEMIVNFMNIHLC